MRIKYCVIAAALLAGCSRAPETASAPKAEGGPEPLKATVWTQKGELYLEYPPLVANEKVRFAIHLTRLSDFHAVKDATCRVLLDANGRPAEFPCDPSAHPGIFGANVQPAGAGDARLSIEVRGKDLNEIFQVGVVKVAASASTAEKPETPREEFISFTKEQQWALDFGTQVIQEQAIRATLRVPAETAPRSGGVAAVVAPLAGRLILDRTFAIGSVVAQGTEMANIVPPTNSTADVPSLQLAQAEARVALEQAQRDRQRAERLLAAGAVPARRLEEARVTEATLQARLQAAEARLAQLDATRSAQAADGIPRFKVRAPITGVVIEATAVSGANVDVGASLYKIVDTDSLYVVGAVAEADFARLRQVTGAEIEMPEGEIRPAARLISIGRLVNPETQTVPVTYEIDNRDHRVAVNETVFLRLLLSGAGAGPVIPESALVDDGGRPIVFVQTAGESFSRRPVKLGIRNSGMVQVIEGVKPGERVVAKGAYLIRLSTMSSSVPAHGHVH